MVSKSFAGIVAALVLAAGSTSALAQGTAITYQGQLKNSGTAVNSATDMQFSLWTLAVGGTQVGSTVTSLAVPVADGLFTAPVDFGVNPYSTSQNLFLQIAVRNPAGAGSYVPMGSRQLLTPAPFSLATRGIEVDSIGNVKITKNQVLGTTGPTGGRLHIQSGNDGTLDGLYLNPFPGGGRVYIGNGSGAGEVVAYDSVGIGGAPATNTKLHVKGGRLRVDQSDGVTGSGVLELTNGTQQGVIYTAGGTGDLILSADTNRQIGFTSNSFFLNNVGIGTTAPGARLDVVGNAQCHALELRLGGASPYIDFSSDNSDYGARMIYDPSTDALYAQGITKFSVNVLEIRGGSDLVEGFDSQTADLEPGTLMVIDPAHPGQLMPSSSAYDSKVAGIVSGANGVNPGIKMGQDGVMDGKNLIAMTGRVYVKCSSVNGTIKPGDLLTTSDVAGHAMKASDAGKSQGTVVGKAMSSLDAETGMVLVLVNLQ